MAKLVAVCGCRHGLGCSNLVANLAVILAKRQSRVGLIDIDLQGPALHLLFGLTETTLAHDENQGFWGAAEDVRNSRVISWLQPCRLESLPQGAGVALLSRSRSFSEATDYLCAVSGVESTEDALSQISEHLSLDYLLIDLHIERHADLDQEALKSFTIIESLVILVGMGTYDFQQAALMVDIADRLKVPEVLLIPSYVPSSLTAHDVHQRFEAAFQAKVAGILPFSEEMASLASRDVFALNYPNHVLTQAVHQIADHLEQAAMPSSSEPELTPADFFRVKKKDDSEDHHGFFRILELSPDHRSIVTCLLRSGDATLDQLSTRLELPQATLEERLQELLAMGWVSHIEIETQTYYHSQVHTNRGSS